MIQFDQLSYHYAHQEQPALENVNLRVAAGEVVLITGPSGCGKSTLGRVINGLIPSHFGGTLRGQALLNGQDLRCACLHDLTRIVGSLFQDPEQQFLSTTVEDEIRLALEWGGHTDHHIQQILEPIVERLGLSKKLNLSLFTLSEGEKQKVALAAILALKPRILMLDEPTANLDHASIQELLHLLLRLKQEGMTIILFDHRLYWTKDLVDSVHTMQDGTVAHSGAFAELESLRDSFGLRSTAPHHITTPPLDSAAMQRSPGLYIKQIDFAFARHPPLFHQFSGGFPAGKVVAMVGANGRGKTTVARIIMGLEKPSSGTISIGGLPMAPNRRREICGLVVQNTELQLYMRTVAEELESAAKHAITGDAHNSKPMHHKQLDQILARFQLGGLQQRHPQSLSGGERQRLVIACALQKEPQILILDEPTSGLDGHNMELLGQQVHEMAQRGSAVVMITHDHELINNCCDYVWDISQQGE